MSDRKSPPVSLLVISLCAFFLGIVVVIIYNLYIIPKSEQRNRSTPNTRRPTAHDAPLTTHPPDLWLDHYAPPPRTKTDNCQANGPLPDPACTPGAVLEVSAEHICVKGYAKTVRHVTTATKREAYRSYGITSHGKGEYEVDHLISLELGGSNDLANLWPEAANPQPGFRQKDKLENFLHRQVCDKKISLTQAQRIIATDWLTYYDQHQVNAHPHDDDCDGEGCPLNTKDRHHSWYRSFFLMRLVPKKFRSERG